MASNCSPFIVSCNVMSCATLQGRSPSRAKHSKTASPAAERQKHHALPGLSTMHRHRVSSEDSFRDAQCHLQAAMTSAKDNSIPLLQLIDCTSSQCQASLILARVCLVQHCRAGHQAKPSTVIPPVLQQRGKGTIPCLAPCTGPGSALKTEPGMCSASCKPPSLLL